jgi:hypothetical protein
MAIPYSPKQRFQQNTERRQAWSGIVGSHVYTDAIIHAQASMAAAGFKESEMTGVNNFIVYLSNLSEDIPVNNPIPAKQLKSYDEPFGKPPTETH